MLRPSHLLLSQPTWSAIIKTVTPCSPIIPRSFRALAGVLAGILLRFRGKPLPPITQFSDFAKIVDRLPHYQNFPITKISDFAKTIDQFAISPLPNQAPNFPMIIDNFPVTLVGWKCSLEGVLLLVFIILCRSPATESSCGSILVL